MKKHKQYLNEAEWRAVIQALNEFRTKLINEGRYTDVVDEVLIKIINAMSNCKVTALCNQKSGVTKTTITANLGIG